MPSGSGGAIYVEDGISFWSNGIFDRNSIRSADPPYNSFVRCFDLYENDSCLCRLTYKSVIDFLLL